MRRRLTCVHRSTGYRALGVLLLLGAAAWSGYAVLADGPAVDEAPHLAAGISYVRLLDYRLNPEHPPLEKVAAGLMASLAGPVLPTDAPWWDAGINEQWRAGEAVLWDGRNDPGTLLALGRLGVLLLNLALLTLGWRLVARRWGEGWALAFLALLASSPFFLGHAHLVTTDVAAAGTGLIACAAFAAYLRKRTLGAGALAALAFGIAQLSKFSMALLAPAFLVAALVVAYQASGRDWRALGRAACRALLPMLAGFALIVYPAYVALTWNGNGIRQERDAAFLLGSFAGGERFGVCRPARCVANLVIAASGNPVTRPAATYALGVLMVAQRSEGGSTTYFDGEVGAAGSRAYFPTVYLAKETLPALLLLSGGIGLLLWRRRGTWRETGRAASFDLVAGTFFALYAISTLKSSLNIGVRHLFPVIPILYLLALGAWRKEAGRVRPLAYVAGALVLLHVATGFSSLPYPLAYYGLQGGGTDRGYLVAGDSNFDWGQDAILLREWVDAHPGEGRIAVDIFGASDPERLVGPRAVAWWSARGNPAAYGVRWLAVSANVLLLATGTPVPGEPRLAGDEYRWLKAVRDVLPGEIPEPDMRIGTSIFLYRLE